MTVEVQDRKLFARVVQSLLAEAGKYAEEPYLLTQDDGTAITPKRGLLMVTGLPELPFRDRAILTKLYQRISANVELDSELYALIQDAANRLHDGLEQAASGMWGDYAFANEWRVDAYCKTYGFAPIVDEASSLLENCIRFLGLCSDVGLDCPIVLVNAKSFLSRSDYEELLEQAFFLDSKLVFLESWHDDRIIARERKTTIDLHFLVETRLSSSQFDRPIAAG